MKESSASVRVRYSEIDAMGWVYYANYLSYFEVGRTEYIRKLWKSYREIEESGYRLPVLESGCRHYVGARYDDLLDVQTKCYLPTPVRIRFDYRIVRNGDDALIAEGHTVHCFMTFDGKPARIPKELLSLISYES